MATRTVADDVSEREALIRDFLQSIACFIFGHQSISIISHEGEKVTSREECIFCGKALTADPECPIT